MNEHKYESCHAKEYVFKAIEDQMMASTMIGPMICLVTDSAIGPTMSPMIRLTIDPMVDPYDWSYDRSKDWSYD